MSEVADRMRAIAARAAAQTGAEVARQSEDRPTFSERFSERLAVMQDQVPADVLDRIAASVQAEIRFRSWTHYLRTAEQYDRAPSGTVVEALASAWWSAATNTPPKRAWTKHGHLWVRHLWVDEDGSVRSAAQMSRGDRRRVLKWGDQ